MNGYGIFIAGLTIAVVALMYLIAGKVANSISSSPVFANITSRCTFAGQSQVWACAILRNGTAICGSGGACLPFLCHYPPACNATQIAIINKNSTSFIMAL